MSNHITVEKRGHLLLMGFNRPEKYNAFTPAMYDTLAAAYHQLHTDPDLRVGVLWAAGDHFTGGLDLPLWGDYMADGKGFRAGKNGIDPFGLDLKNRCAKPVVMAAQGICYTLGWELMLACDIRIAASDMRLAMLEVKRGFYPTGGATIRMEREIGWGHAQRYLLTGDEMHADEAYRLGLVQEVVEPGQQLERAIELAEKVAQGAPLGVQACLHSARLARDAGQQAAIDDLMPLMAKLSKTDDVAEGLNSFIERRDAVFTGC